MTVRGSELLQGLLQVAGRRTGMEVNRIEGTSECLKVSNTQVRSQAWFSEVNGRSDDE